jgi:hypothetical protein
VMVGWQGADIGTQIDVSMTVTLPLRRKRLACVLTQPRLLLLGATQACPRQLSLRLGIAYIGTDVHTGSGASSEPRAAPAIGGRRITYSWLTSLPPRQCKWWFMCAKPVLIHAHMLMYSCRFTCEEILKVVVLLEIPNHVYTTARHHFTGLEAFCLLLARFHGHGDMCNLITHFHRSQSSLSLALNWMVRFINHRWSSLLTSWNSTGVMHPQRLAEYADAAHNSGAPMPCISMFVDCIFHQFCRELPEEEEVETRVQGQSPRWHNSIPWYRALRHRLFSSSPCIILCKSLSQGLHGRGVSEFYKIISLCFKQKFCQHKTFSNLRFVKRK